MPAKKDVPNALIKATLKLAAEKPWHDVTMIDIAQEAGLSVADCYDHCNSKGDILRRFVKQIDREVLADIDNEDFTEPGHDRLIAVIMARFDALAEYRPALKSIIADHGGMGPTDSLRAIKTHFGSMRWMLEAAGFQTAGLHGSLRVAGLVGVYARTFRQWLDDETNDFSPTMALLDRELSRAADWDGKVEKGLVKASRLCGKISSTCRRFSTKKSTTDAGSTSAAAGTSNGSPAPENS